MDSFGRYQVQTDGRKMWAEFDLLPQQMELHEALPENPTEARLRGALDESGDPQHIDELCRATSLPVAEVSGALVMIDLKGLTRLGRLDDLHPRTLALHGHESRCRAKG
jgi:hypothetical protein